MGARAVRRHREAYLAALAEREETAARESAERARLRALKDALKQHDKLLQGALDQLSRHVNGKQAAINEN